MKAHTRSSIITTSVVFLVAAVGAASAQGRPSTSITGDVSARTAKVPEKAPPAEDQKAQPLVVDKTAIVFVGDTSATLDKAIEDLKKQYSEEELSEVASGTGFYEMKVRDFAQEKRIDVIDTNQSSVVFKMKNGGELVVKNTIQGISSAVYMFDGKKEPQRIQDVATFDDGKEFQRYFGTKN